MTRRCPQQWTWAGHLNHWYDSGKTCAQHGQRNGPGCCLPFPARLGTCALGLFHITPPARRHHFSPQVPFGWTRPGLRFCLSGQDGRRRPQHAECSSGAEGSSLSNGTRQSGPHWRRVAAALANHDARTAYAQVVLGARLADVAAGLAGQRRDRAIAALLESGLVERTADDGLEASETIFRDLLSQQPKRLAETGVARFMRLGRIERYPANKEERRELLAWIASEAIEPGENLTERQVNERLLSYTDDVVMLRRYMIDFGVLERTPSGSSYSRPLNA